MEGKDLVIVHLLKETHSPRSAFHKTVHRIVDKHVDKICKDPVADILHLIAQNSGGELYLTITDSCSYTTVITC